VSELSRESPKPATGPKRSLVFPDPTTISENDLKIYKREYSNRLAGYHDESMIDDTLVFSRFIWEARDSHAASAARKLF
jgi:hypothetical protein